LCYRKQNAAFVKNHHRGIATIRKRYGDSTAIVTVGVRVEPGDFSIRSDFEQPVVLHPSPACSAQFSSNEQLFQCCEGSAHSGVFFATRHCRDRVGCVVFTKFDSAELPPDCGMGFAVAASLACFHALGEHEKALQMDMDGWQEI
jgi:hypothetical protein